MITSCQTFTPYSLRTLLVLLFVTGENVHDTDRITMVNKKHVLALHLVFHYNLPPLNEKVLTAFGITYIKHVSLGFPFRKIKVTKIRFEGGV